MGNTQNPQCTINPREAATRRLCAAERGRRHPRKDASAVRERPASALRCAKPPRRGFTVSDLMLSYQPMLEVSAALDVVLGHTRLLTPESATLIPALLGRVVAENV